MKSAIHLLAAILPPLLISLGCSGCYLGHLARGQVDLLRQRVSISEILNEPETPEALRHDLETVQTARRLAAQLGLEVGDQYTSYVDWPGDRVVTVVVTTRPGEIEPAGQTFPLVGRVPYRGFFTIARAEAEADRQAREGMDVCVVGVPAYSTLGWFDDPVTAPMLQGDDADVVQLIVHELVHATFYVSGEARFNEGVASFIGEEASVMYTKDRENEEGAHERRQQVDERRRVHLELSSLRDAIQSLYRDEPAGPSRNRSRERFEQRARRRIRALPLMLRDPEQLSADMQLNDACLALAGTYSADLPDYSAVLAVSDGDLAEFVQRARRAAEHSDPRAALLSDPRPVEVRRDRQTAP